MCSVWNGLLTNQEHSSEFVFLDERDWYGYTYEAARWNRDLRVFCCTQYGETLATVKGAEGYSVVPNTTGNKVKFFGYNRGIYSLNRRLYVTFVG
jgi:hypothetical protein